MITVRPQMVVAGPNTQANMAVRHFVAALVAAFGEIPKWIQLISLDSCVQKPGEVPYLTGRYFLNCARVGAAECIQSHLTDYAEISKWRAATAHDSGSFYGTGFGTGADRGYGMLTYMCARAAILEAFSERLALYTPASLAKLAAETNRNPNMTQSGIMLSDDDATDIWLVGSLVGGSFGPFLAEAADLHCVAERLGVRINLNAIFVLPQVGPGGEKSVKENRKLVNGYAALSEAYAAMTRGRFSIEGLDGNIAYDGQMFQTILLVEPTTGQLDAATRDIGEHLLLELVTTAIGHEFHRSAVDEQDRVLTRCGKFGQTMIFSSAATAKLYGLPENWLALGASVLTESLVRQVLDGKPGTDKVELSAELIDAAGISYDKLMECKPTVTPLQSSRKSDRAVDKAIARQGPVVAAEMKTSLDAAVQAVDTRIADGCDQCRRALSDILRARGPAAHIAACNRLLDLMKEVLATVQEARSEAARLLGERPSGTVSAGERLAYYNRRNNLTLVDRFLKGLDGIYKDEIESFRQLLGSAKGQEEKLKRTAAQKTTARVNECARAALSRPQRVLDADDMERILLAHATDLHDTMLADLDAAWQAGGLRDETIAAWDLKARELADKWIGPLQAVRLALPEVSEERKQAAITQLLHAATPNLRVCPDYLESDRQVIVSVSEQEPELLELVRACATKLPFAPVVQTTQPSHTECLVALTTIHGIEPNAISAVLEGRAALQREMQSLSTRSRDGTRRTIVPPWVDQRFEPLTMVVPSGERCRNLMLIPFFLWAGELIRYDGNAYVLRNGGGDVRLGSSRPEAFETLTRKTNRPAGLPPIEHLVDEMQERLNSMGNRTEIIRFLEKLEKLQDDLLQQPAAFTAADKLILEDERLAMLDFRLTCVEGEEREQTLKKVAARHGGADNEYTLQAILTDASGVAH